MAGVGNRKSAAVPRQPSRLQRRAPASIQVNPLPQWNAAIPLLSPLIQSPVSDNPMVEIKPCSNINKDSSGRPSGAAAEKPSPAVVMKKWQHPAAPFCYEQAPLRPFVCTGSLDR